MSISKTIWTNSRFRFNRRKSASPGKLFYRLAQQPSKFRRSLCLTLKSLAIVVGGVTCIALRNFDNNPSITWQR